MMNCNGRVQKRLGLNFRKYLGIYLELLSKTKKIIFKNSRVDGRYLYIGTSEFRQCYPHNRGILSEKRALFEFKIIEKFDKIKPYGYSELGHSARVV
jgi:hypothetical protein